MTDFEIHLSRNLLLPLVSFNIALLSGDYLSVTYPKRCCSEDLLVCRVWAGLFFKPLILPLSSLVSLELLDMWLSDSCNCLKRNTSGYFNSVDWSPGSTGVNLEIQVTFVSWLPLSAAVICLTVYLCVQVWIGYQWLQVYELPLSIDVICMLLCTATQVSFAQF